jgi:hypothetical protein
MIDITTESLLRLHDATTLLPAGRGGARPNISTILRWILRGVPGPDGERVRLEGVRIGARWVTSREALQRFGEALTPRLDGDKSGGPTRTPTQRQRAIDRATKKLEAAGV